MNTDETKTSPKTIKYILQYSVGVFISFISIMAFIFLVFYYFNTGLQERFNDNLIKQMDSYFSGGSWENDKYASGNMLLVKEFNVSKEDFNQFNEYAKEMYQVDILEYAPNYPKQISVEEIYNYSAAVNEKRYDEKTKDLGWK